MAQLTIPSIISHAELRMIVSCSMSFIAVLVYQLTLGI
jgi:hypothetical protein